MIVAGRCILPFLLLAVTLCDSVSAELRTWTDSTGKFRTEAEFVSLSDGLVTLRKANGKEVKLPLKRLSGDDQALARELSQSSASTPRPSRPTQQAPNNVINSVRGAAYRAQTLNNIKQISLALMTHESTKRRFPAAAIRASDGKPGLSWRVAILPFMEEGNLHRQFHLDEPWDSPHNKALVARMPKVFRSPGTSTEGGYTNYLSVRLPNSVIVAGPKGTRISDVRDGTSRTIIILEVDDDHAAIWTKPDDYEWDPEQPWSGLGNIWSGQFFAGFADAHVQAIPVSIPTETLEALFTRNGGENVSLPR